MKQGTISVLFGCHSVVHSFYVTIAWIKMYKRPPNLMELVSIFVHDIGHIGKQYLDNVEEKNEHWRLGANISGALFGASGYKMVAGHCPDESGIEESKLCKPDKYAHHLAPRIWFYINTFIEPKLRIRMGRWESVDYFKTRVKESIESGEYRSSHEIYLERCEPPGSEQKRNKYGRG